MSDYYRVKYTIFKLKEGKYIKGFVASKCYYVDTIMKDNEIKHRVLLPYTDLLTFEKQFPYPNMNPNFVMREVDDIYDNYEEAKEQIKLKNIKTIDHIKLYKSNNVGLLEYAMDCIELCEEFEEYIEQETKSMIIGKVYKKI